MAVTRMRWRVGVAGEARDELGALVAAAAGRRRASAQVWASSTMTNSGAVAQELVAAAVALDEVEARRRRDG